MNPTEWMKKIVKKQLLANNRLKGELAEMGVGINYSLSGHNVRRTGRGSDFEMQKLEDFTGKRIGRKTLVEVKSGGSKLSDLQKETKKKHEGRYKIIRAS